MVSLVSGLICRFDAVAIPVTGTEDKGDGVKEDGGGRKGQNDSDAQSSEEGRPKETSQAVVEGVLSSIVFTGMFLFMEKRASGGGGGGEGGGGGATEQDDGELELGIDLCRSILRAYQCCLHGCKTV